MDLAGRTVAITGAGRGFGRGLALRMGRLGATLFLSARSAEAAEKVAAEVRAESGAAVTGQEVYAAACDLSSLESVREFAAFVGERTNRLDVLVNNGAPYLPGPDLLDADDAVIADTIAAGATGTVLVTKHLLPLLRSSTAADVVNLVSSAAEQRNHRSDAHPAFYAAKAAQAGFADVLSARLRPEGIRVISLYPPDFSDHDPADPADPADLAGAPAPRPADGMLSSYSVAECVLFALSQPRDCFIRSFHFEQF